MFVFSVSFSLTTLIISFGVAENSVFSGFTVIVLINLLLFSDYSSILLLESTSISMV